MRAHTDSFTETGGAAALSGTSETHTTAYSNLGMRAAETITLASGTTLVPHASVAWQHAFNDVTPTSTLAFLNTGAGFTVAGVPIARDSALVEAGAELMLTRNASVSLSYVGQLAGNAQDHAVQGRAVIRF